MSKFILNEETLVETKEDIQKFINKFGEDNYNKLKRYKDRLKNKNISTDLTYHIKNTSVDDFIKIIGDVENKVATDELTGEAKLNRKLIFENDTFVVWRPLDWQTSMNMGDGTIWCITGRYETDEVKPSQAKQYFNEYLRGQYASFNFVINKKTNEKWCVCPDIDDPTLLPTIWTSDDEVVEVIPGLPSIPEIGIVLQQLSSNGQYYFKEPGTDVVLTELADKEAKIITVEDNITKIGSAALMYSQSVEKVILPDSIITIADSAFAYSTLHEINIPKNIQSIEPNAFENDYRLTVKVTSTKNLKSDIKTAFAGAVIDLVIIKDTEVVNCSSTSTIKTKDLKIESDSELATKNYNYVYQLIINSIKNNSGLKNVYIDQNTTDFGDYFLSTYLLNDETCLDKYDKLDIINTNGELAFYIDMLKEIDDEDDDDEFEESVDPFNLD